MQRIRCPFHWAGQGEIRKRSYKYANVAAGRAQIELPPQFVVLPSAFPKHFPVVCVLLCYSCSAGMNTHYTYDIPLSLCSLQIVFIAVAIFYTHTHTQGDPCAYALWAWRVTVVAFEIYVDSFSMQRVSGGTCYAYAVLHTNEAPQTQQCSRVANSYKYIYICTVT